MPDKNSSRRLPVRIGVGRGVVIYSRCDVLFAPRRRNGMYTEISRFAGVASGVKQIGFFYVKI